MHTTLRNIRDRLSRARKWISNFAKTRLNLILEIVLVLVILAPLILYLCSYFNNRSITIATVNVNVNENANGVISFTPEHFEFSAKTLHVNVYCSLSEQEKAKVSQDGGKPNVFFSTYAPDPFKLFGQGSAFGILYMGVLDLEGVGNDIDVKLQGDEFFFPFDKYRAPMSVSPITLTDEVRWLRNFEDYNLAISEYDTKGNLELIVHRALFVWIFIIVLIFLLILLAVIFVRMTWRTKRFKVGSLLALFAVIIAIPALRILLVPSEIEGQTIVDIGLFIAILIAFYGVLHNLVFSGRQHSKH
jgi:hypothetical protein